MQDQNNSELTMFSYEGAELRTIAIEGETWFVAPDACRMLDLRDTTSALKMVDAEDKLTLRRSEGPHFPQGLDSRIHTITVVNESGMWSLVIQSNKEQAAKVRRWLTGTVLPEIRRTGSFNAQPAVSSPEEQMALGLLAAQKMLAAKDEQIAELAPAANSWNKLADAAGDFSVAEAAKILSRDPAIVTGRDRLFAYMDSIGWIFKSRNPRGGWEAYQTQVDTGRVCERPAKPFLNSKTGNYELPAPTLRITAKGIQRLHVLLGGGPEGPNFMKAVAS